MAGHTSNYLSSVLVILHMTFLTLADLSCSLAQDDVCGPFHLSLYLSCMWDSWMYGNKFKVLLLISFMLIWLLDQLKGRGNFSSYTIVISSVCREMIVSKKRTWNSIDILKHSHFEKWLGHDTAPTKSRVLHRITDGDKILESWKDTLE